MFFSCRYTCTEQNLFFKTVLVVCSTVAWAIDIWCKLQIEVSRFCRWKINKKCMCIGAITFLENIRLRLLNLNVTATVVSRILFLFFWSKQNSFVFHFHRQFITSKFSWLQRKCSNIMVQSLSYLTIFFFRRYTKLFNWRWTKY